MSDDLMISFLNEIQTKYPLLNREWSAVENAKEIIQKPSAEPKTGHWILHPNQNEDDIENDNYMYVCSECSHADIHSRSTVVPYCWYCGARMAESEE